MVETAEIIASGQGTGNIHCLTIPLHEEVILLPNAAIAEVVGYKEPEAIKDAPEWFLGFLSWRDRRVPVISFEAVSGRENFPPRKNSRLAVLNTLNGNNQLPYIAILSQGIPSLALVQNKGINESKSGDESRMSIKQIAEVGGMEVIIPDLDDLEQRMIKLNLV